MSWSKNPEKKLLMEKQYSPKICRSNLCWGEERKTKAFKDKKPGKEIRMKSKAKKPMDFGDFRKIYQPEPPPPNLKER